METQIYSCLAKTNKFSFVIDHGNCQTVDWSDKAVVGKVYKQFG